MLNTTEVKKDFPILSRKINDKPLTYLDNAATTQKPNQVLDAITDYYKLHNANVHRGLHTLSEEATQMYEDSRKTVAEFIGTDHPNEVVFTAGATDSLNMIAISYALNSLKKGDKILVTDIEHHSNLVPWQMAAKISGADLEVLEINVNNDKSFLSDLEEKLNERVKIVAITHASNVTAAIYPIKEVSKLAKKFGAVTVIDGAQALPHIKVNVKSLDCDFYAFSGHKALGPMGVGVLYGREELLKDMKPYRFGGGMIDLVETTTSTYAEIPEKFEAGTPNVEGAVGLAAALKYLQNIGMDNIREHEIELNKYAFKELTKIKGINIIGSNDPVKRAGLVSFTVDGIHPHDIASVLDTEGVAVRSGHHCAMPLHTKLNIGSSTRASFYIYNDIADIDRLVKGLYKAIEILK